MTPLSSLSVISLMFNFTASRLSERDNKYVSSVQPPQRMVFVTDVTWLRSSRMNAGAGVRSMSYASSTSSCSQICSRRKQQCPYAHNRSFHSYGQFGSNSLARGTCPRTSRPEDSKHYRFRNFFPLHGWKSSHNCIGKSMKVWREMLFRG